MTTRKNRNRYDPRMEPEEDKLDPDGEDAPPPRRIAGWQRALRWGAWLAFLGLAIAHSDRESFGAVELLALTAAIAVSIWCLAKPLGGPKVEIDEPVQVRGTFVSRANWGLVLFGTVLAVGGIGATGAIVYDISTGRATLRDVVSDMATFVAGWTAEVVTGWSYDAHLEGTHAYALFVLVVPGVWLVGWNLVPFLKPGDEFRVEPDASVWVRGPRGWVQVLEYEYSAVDADGTRIRFSSDRARIRLPQARVFCRDNGARLRPRVSAEFFQHWLTQRGFTIEMLDAKDGRFRARSAV